MLRKDFVSSDGKRKADKAIGIGWILREQKKDHWLPSFVAVGNAEAEEDAKAFCGLVNQKEIPYYIQQGWVAVVRWSVKPPWGNTEAKICYY